MLASHTQQLMEEELFVALTGEWRETLMANYPGAERLAITPKDIQVNFDVVVKDGTISTPDYLSAWTDVFKIVAENPLLSQRFDIVNIFKHLAKLTGAKDVDRFEAQPAPAMQGQVMPDEQVMREAERGNLINMEQMGGM